MSDIDRTVTRILTGIEDRVILNNIAKGIDVDLSTQTARAVITLISTQVLEHLHETAKEAGCDQILGALYQAIDAHWEQQ